MAVSALRAQSNFVDPGNSSRLFEEPLYDRLINLDLSGKLDASSGFISLWTASPDGATWTVKTRDGVLFHDGTKATSSDVKFTLDYNTRPETTASGAAELTAQLRSVETPDDSTAVISLKRRNIFFPDLYLGANGAMVNFLLPQKAITTAGANAFSKRPVGSGPFKLVESNINQNIVYQAVDKHWYYGVPKYRTLEFQITPEPSTRNALLRTGEVQVIESGTADANGLRSAGFSVYTKAGESTAYVNVHQQHMPGNPLGNVKVRQALSVAIDRQAIVEAFMLGFAKPSVDYPVTTGDPAYRPHPVPPYDPKQAKQLLADAGFVNNLSLDMIIDPPAGISSESPQIMEAIAAGWEQIGVKVSRYGVDHGVYRDKWFGQKFTVPTVGGPLFTPRSLAVRLTGGFDPKNASRSTEDAELADLAAKLGQVASIDAYIPIAQAIQDQILAKWIYFPLFTAGAIYAGAKGLGPWDLGPVGYSININSLATGK